PDEDSTRKADYYFGFPYTITDTTVFLLEDGLRPESLPEDLSQSFDFGQYNSHYTYDEQSNELRIISQLQVFKEIAAASEYKNVVDFTHKVAGDTNEKIVFLKE